MSKDNPKEAEIEKDHDTVNDHPHDPSPETPHRYEEMPAPDTTETYFFPNDGGITSFSCRADSREEAEERNAEHLETLTKENR